MICPVDISTRGTNVPPNFTVKYRNEIHKDILTNIVPHKYSSINPYFLKTKPWIIRHDVV